MSIGASTNFAGELGYSRHVLLIVAAVTPPKDTGQWEEQSTVDECGRQVDRGGALARVGSHAIRLLASVRKLDVLACLGKLTSVKRGADDAEPSCMLKVWSGSADTTHMSVLFEVAPMSGGPRLTRSERQLLEQIANGMTIQQASSAVGCSYDSGRKHLSNAYAKLEVPGQVQAIVKLHATQVLTPVRRTT